MSETSVRVASYPYQELRNSIQEYCAATGRTVPEGVSFILRYMLGAGTPQEIALEQSISRLEQLAKELSSQ